MYDSLSRQVADSLEAASLPGIGDTRRQPQVIELLSRIGRNLFDVDLCLIMRASDKHWISEIGEMLGRYGKDHACKVGRHSGWLVQDLLNICQTTTLPFVTHDPAIRFMAWVDILDFGNGQLLSVVIADREPQAWTADKLKTFEQFVELVAEVYRNTLVGRDILQLVEENRQLRKLAAVDHLTGLWNRETVLGILEREIERCHRQSLPISLIVADLDHFKLVNDRHGHLAGDAVLKEVSQRLRHSVRGYDAIGRLGGEEFLIVMSDCNEIIAAAIAERVQHLVRSQPVDAAGMAIPITISQGLVTHIGSDRIAADLLFDWADKAMYRAKEGGRDGVQSHQGSNARD